MILCEDTEMTTGQAADILYVSHPFLIKLRKEGKSRIAGSANTGVFAWRMS
jgi:hypothetical protein